MTRTSSLALHLRCDFALVSLQQMVLFGQNPSQGTLLKASQFLLGACHTTRLQVTILTDDHPLATRGIAYSIGT